MSALGNKQIFSENLKYYIDKSKKSRSEISTALNIRYSTFSEWVNGKKYPRIDKIELLANYFGIKKSDLIEKYASDTQPLQITDADEKKLLEDYRHLNSSGKDKIKEYLSDLAKINGLVEQELPDGATVYLKNGTKLTNEEIEKIVELNKTFKNLEENK